jgi:hypothetical protein
MHRTLATLTTALFVAGAVHASGTEPGTTETDSGEKQRAAAAQIEPAAAPSAERPWLRVPFADQDRKRKRAVPPPGSPADTESKIIKERTAREWKLLTYPTGRIPSMPWTRAREWVRGHVRDAEPWPLEGVPLAGANGPLGELVAPTTNEWTWFGPQPLDSVGTTNNAWQFGIVAGRTGPEALVVDPVSPNVAYAGFVAGGLWRTDDIGSANVVWTPLWEDQEMVTQSVGAIALDPNDHLTLYAGTGDWPAADQHSEGIMKSTDGGVSWTQLGASVFTPYSPTHPAGGNRWASQNVKKIAIDPNDSDTILVGTRYDLYLSHDAGTSWQICGFGNNYTDPLDGAGAINAINRISDIWLDSRGATTVAYVAVGYPVSSANGDNGVYRFEVPSSGCPAWPGDFTTLFGGFPASTGTANGGLTGRIELAGAIGADSRLTLYAQVGEATGNLEAEGTYVLRPDLGSTTWTKLTGSTKSAYKYCSGGAAITGQDWYDLLLAVDPTDDKTLYVGHVDLFKATVNAGYTAFTADPTNLTNVYASGCAPQGTVHPDQHAFDFVPGTGGQEFLLGNDGGVYRNSDRGATTAWQQLNDSIGTIQFYAGQIGADFAGGGMGDGKQWLFGGSQDNGSGSWDSSETARQWTARSLGGDGFFTSFDPIAGSETTGWWITEYVYGDMACSVGSGADGPFGTTSCSPSYGTASTDWSTPFLLDQFHCTDALCRNYLVAGQRVWAAGALGASAPAWQLSATTILTKCAAGCGEAAISANFAPSEPKAAMVGTSDGFAWWTDNLYTGGNCTQAAANTASFSCTPNSSTTWHNVDATNAVLPNRAILGVAFDPTDHTQGYVAVGGFDENTPTTPGHLFSAKWNGASFTVTDKSGNLPNVPAASVAVNPHLPEMVFVGTHFGFYFTDDISANPPVWQRYQHGLPNTVIRHLTLDRGPEGAPLESTTLAAFTYGRGAYALQLPTSGSFCAHPDAPTGLVATTTGDNEITLDWNDPGGVTWNVYRSLDGFAFDELATGVATSAYLDTDVSGGTTYFYKVTAVDGCEGAASAVASALATGACTLPPLFDGLEAVLPQPGSSCSVRLTWSAAASRCGGEVTYNIYRDTAPGTPPGGATLFASGIDPSTACSGGDCTYDDGSIAPSTTYYYVVRAVDSVNSFEETNEVEKQGLGVGPLSADQQLLADDFDSSTLGTLGGWLLRNFGGTGTSSWYGVEQCGAQSGSNEMRFGGLDGGGQACSRNYNVDNLHGVDPNGGGGIAVPYGADNTRLGFWHRWEFEVSSPFCGGPCDGAFLAVDANGDNSFAIVPSAAILTNGYNGSVPAGFPGWTGAQTSYLQSTVDLDAACDADTGALDGCGGRTVKVSWIGYTDVSTNRDGWFVDTVRFAADTPGSCAQAGPQSLTVAKAGAGTGTVTSEPAGIDCGGDCSESYAFGTDVHLTAAADPGDYFVGWSGDCTGSSATCDLTMNGAKSVTATFSNVAPPPAPSDVAASDGTFSDKVRVTWNEATGATSYDVFRNTTSSQPGAAFATGVASPYDDSSAVAGTTYYYWVDACNAGGCTSGGPDSGYRLAPPAVPGSVAASDGTFTDKVQVTWDAAAGATSYDLYRDTTSSQPGAAFATGVASPSDDTSAVAGTTYYYWVNACNAAGCTTGGPDTGVRAIAAFTLTVTELLGSGTGTVTSDPAGIDCPGTCDFPFAPATSVSLSAEAAVDSLFGGWSGDCSGTGTCELTMDAEHSVSATFLTLLIFADGFELRDGDLCSWSSQTGGDACP